MKPERPTSEMLKYLTIENSKVFASVIVVVAVAYHGFIHRLSGQDSCSILLTDGYYKSNTTWQPSGCMMHKYTHKDAVTCARYTADWGDPLHIVFMGDSRIRQHYFALVNSLSDEPTEAWKAHDDLTYNHPTGSAIAEFLWQPIANDSMVDALKFLRKRSSHPSMIIMGSATWLIKSTNADPKSLELYAETITKIKSVAQGLSSKILWLFQDSVNEDHLWEARKMITNKEIDRYNQIAHQKLQGSRIHKWISARSISEPHIDHSEDGLHLPDFVVSMDGQILWNLLCNEHLKFRDGQCCTRREPITNTQLFTASFFLICCLLAGPVWLFTHNKPQTLDVENATETKETHSPYKEALFAFSKLGVIMLYFFMADRLNFFMKENKEYSHWHFFVAFFYFLFLGLFFTEKSKQTKVLHRDQTDEWKGWMQVVILIYHYTGASQVLPIYMQIRVLVSTYLFTSGFGHFCFFWNKADYSIYRFCMVMFRMNFLVITLCFVMNRPYQFYYFVPLVSFWFLCIYLTMAMWPRASAASSDVSGIFYIVVKLGLLTALIGLFYASEVLFEYVFFSSPLQPLFIGSDATVHEWRFRWQLDRFSTLYGMVFGLLFLLGQKYKLWDDSSDKGLFSVPFNMGIGIVALIGFIAYTIFASTCPSKPSCNYFHSYITFIPILCYIVLRNLPGWLRVRYSSLFAWFGRISLELFIGQYHIWLAADTYGLLVLLPSHPGLNTLLCSVVFVCAAHEIHVITGVLAPIIVPNDIKLLLRNTAIFACMLLPLAISHGFLF